jgi:hypothetical protein
MDLVAEPAVQDEFERELCLVGSAITVRRGIAATVTVVDLPLCASVLETARARAKAHGLRATALSSSGGQPCTLVVEADAIGA